MKKQILIFIAIIFVAVPLILGMVLGFAYLAVGPASVPGAVMGYDGKQLTPTSYEWHSPILGGVFFRKFVPLASAPSQQLGTVDETKLPLSFPEGFDTVEVTLQKGGVDYWQGTPEEWDALTFSENGVYDMSVHCTTVSAASNKPYGSFNFNLNFALNLRPLLYMSEKPLRQGDAMAFHITFVPDGVVPTGNTALGDLRFLPLGSGRWSAYVAMSYTIDPGEYALHIEAGDVVWDKTFDVAAFTFPQEHFTVDDTDENNQASTPGAYAEFNSTITPFFSTYDKEHHWAGLFIKPAAGKYSSLYGSRRYINGASTPSSIHKALDIAADEGTPIFAPNNGRVVFADHLLASGFTIVIEHGGGLKSYYYHMSEILVQVDDMVEKGHQIGSVGSTGYTTGPHLHFEMRVAGQTLDPMLLIDGSSQLYFMLGELL